MRPIKFRAWIPKTTDGTSQMFYQKDQFLQSFLRRVNFLASAMEHDSYGEGKYELEQWTGSLDKNGKKIFENDVVFDKFGDMVVVKIEPIDFSDWEDCCAGYGFILRTHQKEDFRKNVEVIGNIHENPDLLTK
ncbi:MAG: YopX family protein [Candidatus Paceibacterota bacterium]|jgi:uncharacterized phage protein (TIGR01671 family)